MILTAAEAAKFLKVNEATVRRLARKNLIPCRKVGKSWRFWRENLIVWVATQGETPCSSSKSAVISGTLKSTCGTKEYADLLALKTKR